MRGGVDTMFVAPVTVGDGAWTAAGSVVTEDVPEGALASRPQPSANIAGYASARVSGRAVKAPLTEPVRARRLTVPLGAACAGVVARLS